MEEDADDEGDVSQSRIKMTFLFFTFTRLKIWKESNKLTMKNLECRSKLIRPLRGYLKLFGIDPDPSLSPDVNLRH